MLQALVSECSISGLPANSNIHLLWLAEWLSSRLPRPPARIKAFIWVCPSDRETHTRCETAVVRLDMQCANKRIVLVMRVVAYGHRESAGDGDIHIKSEGPAVAELTVRKI